MNALVDLPLGLVRDMPADQYHATDAVSNSALNVMTRSMWHYWAEYRAPNRPEREATAAMRAGTLAHCAILEPDALASRYIIKPEGFDGRTKAGKDWIASLPEDDTLQIVSSEQLDNAQSQRAAVLAVPELAELLSNGVAESSAFWIDQDTGVLCKCRPDWVHRLPDGRVILLDIKTTADTDPEAFSKSVHKFGYHRQAAHYSRGYAAATGDTVAMFVLGVVSNSYPFLAVPFVLDDDTAAQGRDEVDVLLAKYAECIKTDHWPAYGQGYQLLGLPAWARQSQELEIGYV